MQWQEYVIPIQEISLCSSNLVFEFQTLPVLKVLWCGSASDLRKSVVHIVNLGIQEMAEHIFELRT